jgi:hypothetical protein
VPAREVIEDLACVGQRACEPVEFGDDQCVALAAGGQGLAQPGAVTVSTGQAVVDVGALGPDARRRQRLALRGQVLLVGGYAGIADQQRRHELLLASRAGARQNPPAAGQAWLLSRRRAAGRQRYFGEPLAR